jgi:hypothetical protein
MKSEFWESAASRYEKVRLVQPRSSDFGPVLIPIWRDVAYYSLLYRRGTDSAHLARVDRDQREALEHKYSRMLDEGTYDGDSLYVFDKEEHFRTFLRALPEAEVPHHFLSQIDGMWVFAPHWNDPNDSLH